MTFTTPVGQLGFHGRDLGYVVEPGTIDVFVGTSSADLIEAGQVMIEAPAVPAGVEVEKAFDGTVTLS